MEFPDLPTESTLTHPINFGVIDVEFPDFDVDAIRSWLLAVAKTYEQEVEDLMYILVTDEFLLDMNIERLEHDTYTDIITFDLRNKDGDPIIGECYISLDRVYENAASFGESPSKELNRVFVHGLLHLCGLGDKSSEDATRMRSAENIALNLL